MTFLLRIAFNCFLRIFIIQWIIPFYFVTTTTTSTLSDHSIGLLTLDHSIGLPVFHHSFGLHIMPVTTRSMAKRRLPCSSPCTSSLICLPCVTDTPVLPTIIDCHTSINSVMENSSKKDQKSAVTSLSERDDSSIFSLEDDFEISKFQNFELYYSADSQQHCVHNISQFENCTMESDCVDLNDSNRSAVAIKQDSPSDHDGIMQMLQMISNQMVSTTQDLQTRLTASELKFTQELQRINLENEMFRQTIREEIQSSLTRTSTPVPQTSVATSSSSQPSASVNLSGSIAPSVPSNSSSNPPQDLHSQMLSLLTETFSKLTTGASESKSEWPKFNGDSKKFRAWYLAIMAQLR